MDPELKAYLDAMRESLLTRMVDLNKETREHAERLNAESRGEITDRMFAVNTETRRLVADQVSMQINEVRRDLTARMVTLNSETRAHAEHLHTEARVLIEDVSKNVGLVWEGVQGIKESLDTRPDDHEQRIQILERKAL